MYVDDIVMLGESAEQLQMTIFELETYCENIYIGGEFGQVGVMKNWGGRMRNNK